MNTQADVSASRGRAGQRFSRVLGVYPQKQSGLFMQRIKIPGGRINWPQWRRVAELATTYAAEGALHVTTRQDIELHNIEGNDVATVQQGLAEVGLSTFGAGGDSLRNITVCAGCDTCAGGVDLLPVAQLVRHHVEQEPMILSLPRKFKVSFSGCTKACAKPWLNDLGFVAQPDGRFTVIGAGSLGAKPALGIELYAKMPARDVLPLCLAALELFAEHGDRHNRRRARLRHIRERLGDTPFRAELDGRLERIRARGPWPCVEPARRHDGLRQQCRLQLPDGNISPTDARRLAVAGEASGAVLRIDLEHGLNLCGPEPVQLPDDLVTFTATPVIMACPGCTTCPRGLVDCAAVAGEIRRTLSGNNLSTIRIAISGCPNNCAHSAVAPIGLVGTVRTIDGRPAPHFRLLTGGGSGTNDRIATPLSVLPVSDVPAVIKGLLRQKADAMDGVNPSTG